jgi:hypothetical protein
MAEEDLDICAFPVAVPAEWEMFQDGMSLRDWFAGQALNGRLADGTDKDAQLVAEEAYAYAQAMLVERQKYEVKP